LAIFNYVKDHPGDPTSNKYWTDAVSNNLLEKKRVDYAIRRRYTDYIKYLKSDDTNAINEWIKEHPDEEGLSSWEK